MPLPLTVSCFSKIQIGFSFLVPAHLGSPGLRAIKRVFFSIAKHLGSDELLFYTFITQSDGEIIFKICEHLTKLQAKWRLLHAPHLHCTFVLKAADLAR